MANINIWIFDSEENARDHADEEGGVVIPPTQLGVIKVVDRSDISNPETRCYEKFPGKWGVAILS